MYPFLQDPRSPLQVHYGKTSTIDIHGGVHTVRLLSLAVFWFLELHFSSTRNPRGINVALEIRLLVIGVELTLHGYDHPLK